MTSLISACETVLRTALLRDGDPPWELWLEALQEGTGADACSILELRDAELVPLAIRGLSADTLGRRFPLAQHPRLQAILASGDIVRFPSDSQLPDPFDGLIPNVHDHLHVHDCIGALIRGARGPLGMVTIDALHQRRFQPEAIEALRSLTALAGLCMDIIDRQRRLAEAVERQSQVSSALLEELRPDPQLIGRSAPMRTLLKDIATVAGSDLTVLIQGETGCGKELVARAIHYGSNRKDQPLISVNCAALPESLVESELFGHVAGAFSGASGSRRGKFEIATQGTLFLDEIGELPLSVQPKLLRALQSGEIQRVGSDDVMKMDVRIIAATNRDLAEEVRAGRFRADLFHRLSIYPVHVPPLRTRGRDVLLLAGHALERNRASLHLRGLRLSADAQEALLSASWPGNVRELEHTISRGSLKAAAEGDGIDRIVTIHNRHLGLATDDDALSPVEGEHDAEGSRPQMHDAQISGAGLGLGAATELFQRRLIEDAVAAKSGNWAAAARALSMDRGNLRRLARRLGIERSG